MYTASDKTSPCYFLNGTVKNKPILFISVIKADPFRSYFHTHAHAVTCTETDMQLTDCSLWPRLKCSIKINTQKLF